MTSILELSAYISIIFFSLLIIFIVWFILSIRKLSEKNLISYFSKITGEPDKPVYDAPAPSTTREVLRDDCTNDTKLRCFFFMNVAIITDLYSQIESQQPIKQIEKISKGTNQNIRGNVKSPIAGAEASYGQKNEQQVETESCYLPSHSSYCKKVMKRLYEDNEVFIFDIEERNYDPKIERTFETCCETLYNDCHAPLPEHWLKIYREQVRKFATSYDGLKKEIEENCQNKRYVITKGDFRFDENNKYVFIKSIGENIILIEIPFDPDKVSKDKLKILTDQKKGNFTVFGKIDRWEPESSKLTIFPMAMY